MKTGSFFGIDFGTTNTTVVHVQSDEQGTRFIPLGEEGNYPFSSIVAIPHEGDKLIFGREVRRKRQEWSLTHEIFLSMKSYLGTDHEFVVGNKKYAAKEITCQFLRYIKRYIKEQHQMSLTEASFAFPVDFTPEARRDLYWAAQRAGIQPIGFIGEATAAYMANCTEAGAWSKIMVIDWGGGTLDTCILGLAHKKLQELSVFGDNIGGDDIDLELATAIHGRLLADTDLPKIAFSDMRPSERDQMIAACEKVKMEFSDYEDDCPLTIRNYGIYGTKTLTITYAFFEGIMKSIIQRRVLPVIEQALKRAGLSKETIDQIIIVGGSSKISAFSDAMSNIFGSGKIRQEDDTQWEVAKGAAHISGLSTKFRLADHVCILLSDDSTYPVLRKDAHGVGDRIEALSFALAEDSQDAHFIFTNEAVSHTYGRISVPTKGYWKEILQLTAEIDETQIAIIRLFSTYMGESTTQTLELNKLPFYYDLELR